MFSKWFLIGTLIAVCGTVVSQREFLDRFHEEFTYYANITKVSLQTIRGWHSSVMRVFILELLLEFGRMIPTMRTESAQFLEVILNFENVSEDCRMYALNLRDVYVIYQNWDIQNCAYSAHFNLSRISNYRFWPYHNPFLRETVRAISQVVETLGRHDLYDLVGIEAELQEELDYFRNLREDQEDMLMDELISLGYAAEEVIRQLDECRQWVEFLQQTDHEYILVYLETNCGEIGTTTEGPVTTTTEGPETTTDGAETTTEGSETTTDGSETTEGPETTTDESETTTEDPETTEGPETTTDESETTTEGSETTEGPETTTDEPETTEGAETTDGPETTTDEPETTEGSETTEDPEVTTDETETTEATEAF